MKKLLIAAAVVALGISLTGCNKFGSSKFEYYRDVLVSVDEKQDGVTTNTTYEWTQDFAPAGEVCKVDGVTIYEDSGHEYSGATVTFYRQYYEGGAEAKREKHVARYYSTDWRFQRSLKVYLIGEDDSETETESWEYEIISDAIQGYVRKVNGIPVLTYSNYKYEATTTGFDINDNGTQLSALITYSDSRKEGKLSEITKERGSGKEVKKVKYQYNTYGYRTGYEVEELIDDEMVLTEKETDYKAVENYISFTTQWYEDGSSTPTSTRTTKKTYEFVKVTVTT